MAKRVPQIGDVYEIRTPAGLGYIQYTHDDPDPQGLGELVRVLPGLYVEQPDVSSLARQKELYFIFYTLSHALRKGFAKFIASEPIPAWAIAFPTMRRQDLLASGNWGIGSGAKMGTLEEMKQLLWVKPPLTSEQRRLSIGSMLRPHNVMVQKLAQGWTPERDEELSAKARAESELKASAAVAFPGGEAGTVEHFLYFQQKSRAQAAAKRLLAKKWEVLLKRAADDESWLVLGKEPDGLKNDPEDIRSELESLAQELGGEYDGWGTAI